VNSGFDPSIVTSTSRNYTHPFRNMHSTISQQPSTMSSLKATAIWLLFSLGVAALAHPDTKFKTLSLPVPNGLEAKGLHRRVPETCSGDCITCFGAGYELCPSSSSICYLPGDSLHGEESCSGIGSIDIPSVPEFCSEGGCETCFGSGECEGRGPHVHVAKKELC